jgi:hypothetical protein
MGSGIFGLYLPGSLSFLPPPIDWRWMGDEAGSACSWVTDTERLLHDTLALVKQNIPHSIRVSLKREENLAHILLASSTLSHPFCVLFLQLLSWGSADVPMLLVEVTRAWEAAATAEVARVLAVLAVETST